MCIRDRPRTAPQAPVLLKQQNGILQLLGKALDFQTVLRQMRPEIGAVALLSLIHI